MHPEMTRLYSAVREYRGIRGPSDLARALNKSPQIVNNWENRGISKQGLLQIQEVLGISASWLQTGKNAKFVLDKENVAAATVGSRGVPLINYEQAEQWMEAACLFQSDQCEWLMTDEELSDSAFALEIKGESMLPEFRPGDRVIIDPSVTPTPGDFVVAKHGAEVTFKKYRPRSAGADGVMVFELVPLNDDYPSILSDVTPVQIIGTMVEHRKYRRK